MTIKFLESETYPRNVQGIGTVRLYPGRQHLISVYRMGYLTVFTGTITLLMTHDFDFKALRERLDSMRERSLKVSYTVHNHQSNLVYLEIDVDARVEINTSEHELLWLLS